ncbi:hypothetical protein C8J56DRAFT_1060729 [Mycena floridula]|nr:hypothetical protein C8J56DRAFT_1060729 [Mycena floridula]
MESDLSLIYRPSPDAFELRLYKQPGVVGPLLLAFLPSRTIQSSLIYYCTLFHRHRHRSLVIIFDFDARTTRPSNEQSEDISKLFPRSCLALSVAWLNNTTESLFSKFPFSLQSFVMLKFPAKHAFLAANKAGKDIRTQLSAHDEWGAALRDELAFFIRTRQNLVDDSLRLLEESIPPPMAPTGEVSEEAHIDDDGLHTASEPSIALLATSSSSQSEDSTLPDFKDVPAVEDLKRAPVDSETETTAGEPDTKRQKI